MARWGIGITWRLHDSSFDEPEPLICGFGSAVWTTHDVVARVSGLSSRARVLLELRELTLCECEIESRGANHEAKQLLIAPFESPADGSVVLDAGVHGMCFQQDRSNRGVSHFCSQKGQRHR